MSAGAPFRRVLIANRGEIAVRVARACRALGVEPVAVYSQPDAGARHVREASFALPLGGSTAAESYLRGDLIVRLAVEHGCDAIHPGYGFLSENAAFARACAGAGVVFVGPRPETIEVMGSKTAARATMEASGVPTVPGYQGADVSEARLRHEAELIGYPVLVKAVFGGGGKGMRVVRAPHELQDAVLTARREAEKAFGDGAVFLEKFVERPRHIEVQVLGDGAGGAVHYFERECSIQRRHQKVIEECPSPSLPEANRLALCEAGRRAAEAVKYLGAGTVEFIVDQNGDFYFLEMNTRLQVEHPVTELVCGEDLVAAQLHVAAGRGLPRSQDQILRRGHAIECRIYAEDPENGYLPSTGTLVRYREPQGPSIRVDGGALPGQVVSPYYDPMLAKLCTWGATRREATERMAAALAEFEVHGVRSNIGFLHDVICTSEFARAHFHTNWIEERWPTWSPPRVPAEILVAAALLAEGAGDAGIPSAGGVVGRLPDPFVALGAFRLGGER